MSIKLNEYVNDIDYCWYDSTNVFYSELHDHLNELKTLYVTFKNKGITYKYENIEASDYILFKHDISQGKAIHKLIKKYKGEPIEFKTITQITETFDLLNVNTLLTENLEDLNVDDIKIYRRLLIALLNHLNDVYGYSNYKLNHEVLKNYENELIINVTIEVGDNINEINFKSTKNKIEINFKYGEEETLFHCDRVSEDITNEGGYIYGKDEDDKLKELIIKL